MKGVSYPDHLFTSPPLSHDLPVVGHGYTRESRVKGRRERVKGGSFYELFVLG